MKRYLYTGLLVGTFILTGCTENTETEQQEIEETMEDLTEVQTLEIENTTDVDKAEEVAAVSLAPLVLTQEQKESYYLEYVAIIENVKSEYEVNLEIEPIDKFLDKDWVEIEVFEKMIKDRANAQITVSENTKSYHPNSVPKTAKIHIGSITKTIGFSGSFETQLNSNSSDGRQMFSRINSISSQVESGGGNWIQTGYDSAINTGPSYSITVEGKYTENGVSSNHLIKLVFYCDKFGAVS